MYVFQQAEGHFDLKSKTARRLILAVAGLLEVNAEFLWRPELCFPQVRHAGQKVFTGMWDFNDFLLL